MSSDNKREQFKVSSFRPLTLCSNDDQPESLWLLLRSLMEHWHFQNVGTLSKAVFNVFSIFHVAKRRLLIYAEQPCSNLWSNILHVNVTIPTLLMF